MGTVKKIFIVHGWTYTTNKWDEFVAILRSAGFEPMMLQVPGLTEATDKVWTLDDYMEWLKEKLQNQDNPVVVAHSNGGRIAIALAAKHSQIISRLILVSSAGIRHNELPIKIKRAVFGTAAKLGKKITSSTLLRKFLYKLAGENDYKNATESMRKTMANLISIDLTSELSKISTPTLIIWGANDKATPVSDGKLMQKLITGSKLHIIEKAAHSPHFTHAKEVSEKILNFIKQNGF